MRIETRLVFTGAAFVAVAVWLAWGNSADAKAAETGHILDVRPTTLDPGQIMVIECPGLYPYAPVLVGIEGRRVPGPGRFRYDAAAQPSTGDRALLTMEWASPLRLEDVSIEVRQGSRTWTLAPGTDLALTFAPRGLSSLARQATASPAWAQSPFGGIPTGYVTAGLLALVALLLHLLVAPLTGLVVVWERKIWGRMQSRIGPNRVGPGGWLQWLADGVKLVLKEDIVPTQSDAAVFRFAPYLIWMSVFGALVVLPLSATAVVADMNVGLLYLVSITSLSVIAILLGGWTSHSKWSLLGGMRSAAQIVSYEVPAALALLQVALLAGSLAPQEIVRAQGGLPTDWFVFHSPFVFASFFIYFIAGLAEGNRTPFDLPEAESELVAGYTTEYSGFRYSIFSLAEWTNLYVLGFIVATMFLGGWNVPFVAPETMAGSLGYSLLGAGLLLGKVVVLVFLNIWVRATLPRLRLDQLMALCWKYLVPLSFAFFLGTAALIWLAAAYPAVATVLRYLTFGVGGVLLFVLFVTRVVANFRGSRLLPSRPS